MRIGTVSRVILCAALALPPSFAQEARGVLDDKDADQADPGALQAEAQLFEIIRQGIALSIAQCELTPSCAPTVSREELRRIVGKLETRLDKLTSRHSASGDAALEPVLLAYVETRDGYNEFLNKLDSILPPEGEEGEARDLGTLPEEYSIFADVEAELTDDTEEPPADAAPAAEPAPQQNQ